jgi:hypothetical protein
VSIMFVKETEDLYLVHIKGTLAFEDLKEAENKARDEIDRTQKVKVLILAERFSGWGKGGDWGDLTFMYEYDSHIEKIAVVADPKWQDQILMFVGANKRQASVEFFCSGQEQDARTWLQIQNS